MSGERLQDTDPLVENFGTSIRQSLMDAIFTFTLSCFVVTSTDISNGFSGYANGTISVLLALQKSVKCKFCKTYKISNILYKIPNIG